MILDEVHAVAGTKRGAHLALSLERLEALVEKPFQRIGLSATQRPLAEIGRFVAGTHREIELVDAGSRKELDLEVVVPLEDMRELGSTADLSVPPMADGLRWARAWSSRAARSGRRSTPRSSSSSASTARRSSSSTTAGSPSASRSG